MGRPRPPPSPLGGSFRDGPHGRDIHPLLIRLTISVSDCRWPGRIAASGECATYLLNSTLPGAVRLKVEGHGVADRERQCIALRLHRTGSGGVARESGEGEQDRDGPGMAQAGSGTALGVAAGPSSRVCTTTKSTPIRRKRVSAVLREKPRKAPWFVPPGVAGEGRPRRGSPRAAHRGHRYRAALRVGWRAARAGRQRSTDLSHGGSWRR